MTFGKATPPAWRGARCLVTSGHCYTEKNSPRVVRCLKFSRGKCVKDLIQVSVKKREMRHFYRSGILK